MKTKIFRIAMIALVLVAWFAVIERPDHVTHYQPPESLVNLESVMAQTLPGVGGALNIIPLGPVYSLGVESGQVITVSASTSVGFAITTNVRHYVTQATCANASSTALQLTIYDDGTGQSANSNTKAMVTIPCVTSTTTGSYTQPVVFNPPLETASGDAVDVGVGTAANSVTISLNGFKGRR